MIIHIHTFTTSGGVVCLNCYFKLIGCLFSIPTSPSNLLNLLLVMELPSAFGEGRNSLVTAVAIKQSIVNFPVGIIRKLNHTSRAVKHAESTLSGL